MPEKKFPGEYDAKTAIVDMAATDWDPRWFYLVPVWCKNCDFQGKVYVRKGQEVDLSYCAVCGCLTLYVVRTQPPPLTDYREDDEDGEEGQEEPDEGDDLE